MSKRKSKGQVKHSPSYKTKTSSSKRSLKTTPTSKAQEESATSLRTLRTKRSLATLIFAALIFAACLLPVLRLECTAAVVAGCLLGAVQGAGAAGLCAIAMLAKSLDADVDKVAILAGSFAAALVSGFLSFLLQDDARKRLSLKDSLKSLAACVLGFAVFYLCQLLLLDDFFPPQFIATDALKCISAAVVCAALRPYVQTLLFPRDKLDDEIKQMTAKLKKR